jgi:hypothetical protein
MIGTDHAQREKIVERQRAIGAGDEKDGRSDGPRRRRARHRQHPRQLDIPEKMAQHIERNADDPEAEGKPDPIPAEPSAERPRQAPQPIKQSPPLLATGANARSDGTASALARRRGANRPAILLPGKRQDCDSGVMEMTQESDKVPSNHYF